MSGHPEAEIYHRQGMGQAAGMGNRPALVIVATVFLAYTFLGPHMPSIIAHKGNSLSEIVNHQWITTEGVFGIALGVSTSFVSLAYSGFPCRCGARLGGADSLKM